MARNIFRNNDNFDISQLKVKIFAVGYGYIGESIIIFIMNGDRVYYSIVIDCYKIRKKKKGPYINKTVDILKQHSVERLDILCWTHPHEDHSKGISTLISKYCDEETKVLFPMYVLNNTSDIVRLKSVSKDIVDGILAANRSKDSLATPIGIPYQSRTIIDEFIITNSYNTDETRAVSIDAITPISSYLTEYVNHGVCKDPNELSISLIVNIDGYGFFFGGDTINKHINGARKRSINLCRFVKIPHHSSPTASELLNYLPGKIDAACTTVYKVGNSLLPDNDIIAKYKGFCPTILSTGDKNTVSKKNTYGIVSYEYDFSRGTPTITPELFENAVIL